MYESKVGNLLCGIDVPISGLQSHMDRGNAYFCMRVVNAESEERNTNWESGQRQGRA